MNFEQRSAAYLILQDLDTKQIVVILRQNTGHQDGNYALPAGHIEAGDGESATRAMQREAGEEIGIRLELTDLQPMHVQQRRDGPYIYFDVYFLAQRWQGQPSNCEPDKCGDLRWMNLDELPTNFVPYTRLVLQDYWPNGIAYSQWGWQEQ